jgi:hypothetical protein
MKHVDIRAAARGDQIRYATFDGSPHLVVPVVAVVEGVIHASNAPQPELVTMEVLRANVAAWNGQPAVLGHPEADGQKISANDPATLDAYGMGRVFNARVSGEKLLMDAYIDPRKADRVAGGSELVQRLMAGQTVEVSVGAFVEVDLTKAGRWNGQPYRGAWSSVSPDHLAILPEGQIGACSINDGCGALRAAEGGVMTCKCSEQTIEPEPVALAAVEDAIEDAIEDQLPMTRWFEPRTSPRALAAPPELGRYLTPPPVEGDDPEPVVLATAPEAIDRTLAASGGSNLGTADDDDGPEPQADMRTWFAAEGAAR